jgi:hypothetical protein
VDKVVEIVESIQPRILEHFLWAEPRHYQGSAERFEAGASRIPMDPPETRGDVSVRLSGPLERSTTTVGTPSSTDVSRLPQETTGSISTTSLQYADHSNQSYSFETVQVPPRSQTWILDDFGRSVNPNEDFSWLVNATMEDGWTLDEFNRNYSLGE